MKTHACILSIREAEAEGLSVEGQTGIHSVAPGQPWLQSETPVLKNKQELV